MANKKYHNCFNYTQKNVYLVDPAGCSYALLAQRLSHASGIIPRRFK
jgi:ATP-dependent protease Clp ATPase subunit